MYATTCVSIRLHHIVLYIISLYIYIYIHIRPSSRGDSWAAPRPPGPGAEHGASPGRPPAANKNSKHKTNIYLFVKTKKEHLKKEDQKTKKKAIRNELKSKLGTKHEL